MRKLAFIVILFGAAALLAPSIQAQSWTVWNGIAAANEATGTNAGTNPVPSRRAWQHLVYDSGVGKVVWDAGQLNCCAGTLNAGLSFFDDSVVAGPGSAISLLIRERRPFLCVLVQIIYLSKLLSAQLFWSSRAVKVQMTV